MPFFCYMETSQRHQMLPLTAVVSHFQPDIMSFKTSRLLPRSGGGAWVIGLEEWRNWTKGRNKHGLIFILELSVWHLFTPGGILQVKPWFFLHVAKCARVFSSCLLQAQPNTTRDEVDIQGRLIIQISLTTCWGCDIISCFFINWEHSNYIVMFI